jgi:hypothetical protein
MVLKMNGKSVVRRDFLEFYREHLFLVCVNVVYIGHGSSHLALEI